MPVVGTRINGTLTCGAELRLRYAMPVQVAIRDLNSLNPPTMNTRQKELLFNITKEHIDSARAVGSKFLVDKYNMDVSSATIRNDMAELEREGYIMHLHTSAGRIPTELGYKYYLENFLDKTGVIERESGRAIDLAKKEGEIKGMAKKIAELSNSAVVVAITKNDLYYTGISNLFSQPEFADFDLIYNLSSVVDHLDEVIEEIYDSIDETQIRIGKDNPFSADCASILSKMEGMMFGIIGPIRMDYEKNLGLINYTKKLLV
jgi:heat-inducible transcriptional repressor